MRNAARRIWLWLTRLPQGCAIVQLVLVVVVLQGWPDWLGRSTPGTSGDARLLASMPLRLTAQTPDMGPLLAAPGAPSPDPQRAVSSRAQDVVCPHDGDVTQDGRITPADALLVFRYFLGRVVLDACQQDRANVNAPAGSPITPGDALCIFQHFLGLASCLDTLPPVADAGADQTVSVATTVQLDGSGSSDVGGQRLTFAWALTVVPAGSTATLSDATAMTSARVLRPR